MKLLYLQKKKNLVQKRIFGLFKRKNRDDENQEVIDPKEEKEEGKNEGNFLSRIFSRKSKNLESDSVTLQKRVFKELTSVRYLFKPIDGIDSKTSHFEISPNGKLINGGLDGLYEISGEKSNKISGEAVRYFIITSDDLLIVSFNSGDINIYQLNNLNNWELLGGFTLEGDVAFHIFEHNNNIWFSSVEYVYRADKLKNYELEKYEIDNPYSDTSLGTLINDTAYFVNPTGYYFYNPSTNKLEQNKSLQQKYGKASKYILEGKNIWIYSNSSWKVLNQKTKQNEYLLNSYPT